MYLHFDRASEHFTVNGTIIEEGDCITAHRLSQITGCEDWDGENMLIVDTGDWYAIEFYESDRGDMLIRGVMLQTLMNWNIHVTR